MTMIKALLICAFLFVVGFVAGCVIISLPKFRDGLRRSPVGFSDKEMSDNLKLRNLRPASEDSEYSRTKDHL